MLQGVARWLSAHGFCAMFGVFVGAIVGSMYGGLLSVPDVANAAIWVSGVIGAGLGVVAWVAGLFVLGVLLRYRVGPVALHALVNAILTGALSAFAVHVIGQPMLGAVVGGVVGFVIGKLLCRLCGRSAWIEEKRP